MVEQGEHPALRRDLRVSRVETPEGPCFVLKDPRTKRYFRLREAEYAVARRLDGATSPGALAALLAAELDVELDADSVAGFAAQLRQQGLLEGLGAPPTAKRDPFIQGQALYLRFRAFDPDALLDWLHPRLKFFYTPYFVVGSVAFFLWAVWTSISERAAIWNDFGALWNLQSLFVAWIVILTVVTIHEFGHGLTCKHFGGEVHEMGFMLIYFQPAFYCNISDAWLFPKRAHRLWVTAGGPWIELTVWSAATLMWTITEPGTWVNRFALIVMATSAVKQFFNLNPLIKLDGYYLLTDLVEIPNLRYRAGEYLTNVFRRLTGGVAAALDVSRRERLVFLTYGVAAVVFGYWFLAQILLGIGDWLTTDYQAMGFGVFAAFVGLVFPQPLRRLLNGPSKPPAIATAAASSAVTASTASSDVVPATPMPAPRHPIVTRRRVLWLMLASAFVASFFVHLPLRSGGAFTLLPSFNADVRAPVEGAVAAVYVDEGDVLKQGDTIARLSDADHRARLNAVNAEIAERQARLLLLQSGPRKEAVALADLSVARAQERLRFTEQEAARVRTLTSRQFASPAELQRAEEQVALASKDVEQERARLAILRAGTRPESVAAVAQEVARAEAERERVQADMARLVLTAPHAGVITTPRLHHKLGEVVKVGDLIAEVHAVDRLTAEVRVSERDLGDVRVGHPVALRFRAYPNRTFEGTVTRIASAVSDTLARPERDVRVDVDLPNDGSLRPGMTGYARVTSGTKPAIDIITRRFRRFIRVEFWSWW